MIDRRSIKHRGLRELVTSGRTALISVALIERVKNRIAVLDAMKAIGELPPSYRAHVLTGRRRRTWAIPVNGPWRLTFRFDKQTVFDLDLEQYH